MTRVVILGGGPAGLGAAYKLRSESRADVVLLERGERYGGNAGSFAWNGHLLDFGSHRLHPSCDPGVLADIASLLGDELLDRPRHGRIRLLGRWLHFPLKPLDLLLHVPPSFGAGAALDALRKMLPSSPLPESEANFATVLDRSLGPTICKHFYMPYAVKLWGRDPTELSAIQARRRVSASSFGKLAAKVLSAVPGLKPAGAGRFFYPSKGYGQICDSYAAAAKEGGADLRLGHSVKSITRRDGGGWVVESEADGKTVRDEADLVWSTIPLTVLARMLDPEVPHEVISASHSIAFRAMVLIYLELDVAPFTEFDAHYFPGPDVRITRLSETRNYAARTEPANRTVICAELPCEVGDDIWNLSDQQLGDLVAEDLETAGVPLPRPHVDVMVKRLPQAYPIYLTGYEEPFKKLDEYLATIPDLLSYGRQGLFAHDNTHHALYMAYAAVECLNDGRFDEEKWRAYRVEFESHVVVD